MLRPFLPFFAACLVLSACDSRDTADVTIAPPSGNHFCDEPGSVRFTSSGVVTVAGGNTSRLAFLGLPAGFCAHAFAYVGGVAPGCANQGNVRQLRFAPNGDLFVAAPTKVTTGGNNSCGRNEIVVLPDDDGDGLSDGIVTYASELPATQGMLFASDGYFYFQDDTRILRVPYSAGDRLLSATPEQVADITLYTSSLHWPKALAQADDGTIYVGNGGEQGESCDTARPFHGGVLKLDGSPGGTPVAKGFRNPIALACERGHNLCFAAELSMDYTAGAGGREKLVPIREGDDWGFPCCFTNGVPATSVKPVPDCSYVTPEDVSFVIGDTPFSFDFAPTTWPAPYAGSVFVPLHGAAGSWLGARVVAVEMDPATGLPKPGTNLPTLPGGAMTDFATGWDDDTRSHGRPSAVAFAPDGRMFVGNDADGTIFWVAPIGLEK